MKREVLMLLLLIVCTNWAILIGITIIINKISAL